MGIIDLYSKRQKRLRGEFPDVYQYSDFPRPLRVQLVYILRDTLGEGHAWTRAGEIILLYREIEQILAREYGLFKLSPNSDDYADSLTTFILEQEDTEKILDVFEVGFRYAAYWAGEIKGARLNSTDAIKEFNGRLREHGLGYQYQAKNIIRVDSEFIHAEVVKPVLKVLSEMRYQGANEEFLKAHEHYRHGRLQPCLVECLKAFESTMKTICSIRQWPFPNNATARSLIAVCFDEGLIPSYLQSQFSSLRSGLESGIPTVRNRVAGHGRGTTPVSVPEYLASYLLHLTATTILFLVEAEKALP